MSQEELAALSGLHRTYITDIERGTRNVSLINIERIARAVGVALSDIFFRFERHAEEEERRPFAAPARNGTVEILLVEDDESFIELMLHQLERWNIGNNVLIMRNGADVLDLLLPRSGPQEKELRMPKVILLDLSLPLVDGMEVLERLRAAESTRALPVVVLTNTASTVIQERCKRFGVSEYLTKPVDMEAFSRVMGTLGFQLILQRSAAGVRSSLR